MGGDTGAGHALAGHRTAPHPADLMIQAWAPTAEQCIAEAVRAMVDGFADLSAARPVAEREFVVRPATAPNGLPDQATDDGLPGRAPDGLRYEPDPATALADELVTVLDEVLYRMDTAGELPTSAEVRRVDSALVVHLSMAEASQAVVIGAVPKAVSLHELHFGAADGRWDCSVILDV